MVVDTSGIYPALIEEIRTFVATEDTSVDPVESVEVIAFIEAANESMERGGEAVSPQGILFEL